MIQKHDLKAIRDMLDFIRSNPNLVHDIRQDTVDRILALLDKIEADANSD